jgi:CRP-like cAMP-binding protein
MLSAADMDFISKVPIFGAMPGSAMTHIGALARRVDVAGPSLIFSEGEPAKEMVIVLSGELAVCKRGQQGAEARIATLKAGDVAGEMSLVDIQPRSAAVRSLGPAALAVLTQGDLLTLYREDRDAYTILVLNIAREISRRLRRVDALLADIMLNMQGVWSNAAVPMETGPAQGKGP